MASTSSSVTVFALVNDKIDAEQPQTMTSTSSSVAVFSLVNDKIDAEQPQAMTSTSSSVTVFSDIINAEQPRPINSTSSLITVTSPVNACTHKTNVETEEQLRTPDRTKSVRKKIYKKWLQLEIVVLSITMAIVLVVYLIPLIVFYKKQVSDNAIYMYLD